MTMNLTQLTTLVVLSACAIAESPTAASAPVESIAALIEPAVEPAVSDLYCWSGCRFGMWDVENLGTLIHHIG